MSVKFAKENKKGKKASQINSKIEQIRKMDKEHEQEHFHRNLKVY